MTGKLIIISAPSGAGKTTIVRHLLETRHDLAFSISATTRLPRGAEKNGTDYYFLTAEEFQKRIRNNEFVEWQEVYPGCFYGTLKSEMERIWAEGKSVLFDVDAFGGINLKKIYGTDAISVFIMPPSVEELEKRLRQRGTDSEEKIRIRIEKAKQEIGLSHKFDRIVLNKNLGLAKREASAVVKSFLEIQTGRKW